MTSPKGRILCTEDDLDTRDLVEYVLTDAGYEIVCPRDAGTALALAQQEHFDLYLLDSWMPGISGRELTRKLRTFDAKTRFFSILGRVSRPTNKLL